MQKLISKIIKSLNRYDVVTVCVGNRSLCSRICALIRYYGTLTIGFTARRLSMCFILTPRKGREGALKRDATIAAKLRKEIKPTARTRTPGSFASITDPRSFFSRRISRRGARRMRDKKEEKEETAGPIKIKEKNKFRDSCVTSGRGRITIRARRSAELRRPSGSYAPAYLPNSVFVLQDISLGALSSADTRSGFDDLRLAALIILGRIANRPVDRETVPFFFPLYRFREIARLLREVNFPLVTIVSLN